MISSGPPQVFVPFGREHYARHPGTIQQPGFNNVVPNISVSTDAGEDILDAIKDFSIREDDRKSADESAKEDWVLRAGPICEEELYYKNNTVIWSKGRWNSCKHVIMAFTVEQPVHQAFWCHFPLNDIHEIRNKAPSLEDSLFGIGIVSNSKLNVTTTDGQDFIVPLPFQVNSVWTMKYGLLLERKMSVNKNASFRDSLPVIFSLLHPLNEVTPVVQRSIVGKLGFLGDQHQSVVHVFEEPSIVVTYDESLKIHTVWKLRLTKKSEEFHTIESYDQFSTSNQQTSYTPGSIPSRIVSPVQRSCSPHRHTSSRINSPVIRSRSQSPMLTNLTHMATISRSQSPSAIGNSMFSLSRTPSPSASRIGPKPPTNFSYSIIEKDNADNGLRKPLASEICLESIWVEPKSFIARDGNLSNKASKVFITTDLLKQKFFCFFVPSYSQLRCIKVEDRDDSLSFGFGSSICAKDAEGLQGSSLMVVLDNFDNLFVYSGITKICKIRIPFGPYSSFINYNTTRQSVTSPGIKSPINVVTSSRPPSALDFTEEVRLLSPVPSELNESDLVHPTSSLEDIGGCGGMISSVVSLRDVVENRISIEFSGGNVYRVAVPQLSTSEIVDMALCSLAQLIPKDMVMKLYSKWYMASHATGSNDTTPLQYWNSFTVVLLGMIGYNIESLRLLFSLDSELSFLNEFSVKRFKPSESGSDEDWNYLLKSDYHSLRPYSNISNEIKKEMKEEILDCFLDSEAPLFSHLPAVHFAIHLLYEELKLSCLVQNFLPHVGRVLYRFARDLRYTEYLDYYWRDLPDVAQYVDINISIKEGDSEKLHFPSYVVMEPPSVFLWIENIFLEKAQEPFPFLMDVNKKLKIVITLFAVLIQRDFTTEIPFEKYLKPIISQGFRLASYSSCLKLNLDFDHMSYSWCEAVVMAMIKLGVTLSDLNIMPSSMALPLFEAINKCRRNPPEDWPVAAYVLIDREDLAAQIDCSKHLVSTTSCNDQTMPVVSESKKPVIQREEDDGMEHLINDSDRLHFSQDMKLQEVQRLLQSSKPVRISITQRSEVDHEFLEEQERHLYSICIRTMAILVGRGMFTLRTSKPIVTETLHIPNLCLTGRAPPRNTTIDLSHIDVPANMNMWPLFHNGVAAGLRLAHNGSDVDPTWIVYNKPRGNVDIPVEHAGFLMSMGLNGHLKNLDPMNIFSYAVKGNEMTSVGLLLGIAAAKRGTMDLATTKLLSIHVEALLPPSSTELDIPHIVQVAAVLGVGLVYQGSSHRHMSEVLLSEIGRPPGPEMENSSDCESYSVSAGLALGLIMLGKGTNAAGLSDLGMADLLYHYMVGGPKRPPTNFAKERYKSPSYQIKEGDAINVDVTSPGATLALGFMFFGTNDSTVAQWMTAPDTQHLLDFVRPDFLLLRTLSKGLIMWESILPSAAWLESHIPKIISSAAVLRKNRDSYVDMETLSQAYCNIIAGACMALGLRFAGTANKEAYNTLLKYARTFIGLLGKSASEEAGRTTIETCINVAVLSLATVMAGTGDLEVLRLCRHLHARIGQAHCQVLYGSHMATHMAIGLLFLGGGRYTLSNSRESVTALVCAFFPKFPTHSNDNRYHLQALRHLYALAVQPRLVIPKDIETGLPCYNHLSVKVKPTKWYDETTILLKAPILLPQLDLISEVRVEDPRYWPVSFCCNKNWKTLLSRLENDGTIFVKRRTGCLSYAEDPNGFKSLLAQSLVKDKCGKWRAKPKAIEALTSDKTVLNVVDKFLHNLNTCTTAEATDQNILTNILYECVTQEKLDVVSSLAALMKIGLSKRLSSMDIWDIRLISSYLGSKFGVGQLLINEESFLAVCNGFDEHIENKLQEHKDCFTNYLKAITVHDLPADLVPFLIRYSLPSAQKIQKSLSGIDVSNVPSVFLSLEELNVPITTIIKVQEYLT